jgi:hypothetical protein
MPTAATTAHAAPMIIIVPPLASPLEESITIHQADQVLDVSVRLDVSSR